MKKKALIITISVVASILLTLLLLGLLVYRILNGPFVSYKEKKGVTEYAINYLNKKYGDHNYKVYKIYYDYDMDTLFDYSNPIGYYVDFKFDYSGKKYKSFLTTNGLYSDKMKIGSDFLIEDIYFKDELGIADFEKEKNIIPKEEIISLFSKKIKEEIDPNTYNLTMSMILDLPDNEGKIPTLEELGSTNKYYLVDDMYFYTIIEDGKKEEYERKIKNYIETTFGKTSYFNIVDRGGNIYGVSVYFDKRINVGDYFN
ncbi:MAG: hypothetical protein IKZ96_04365 [Bacilli bacterium]|nr:hypothetical protein [Bacilli bacterium]